MRWVFLIKAVILFWLGDRFIYNHQTGIRGDIATVNNHHRKSGVNYRNITRNTGDFM
jgi:hypothetical protein